MDREGIADDEKMMMGPILTSGDDYHLGGDGSEGR